MESLLSTSSDKGLLSFPLASISNNCSLGATVLSDKASSLVGRKILLSSSLGLYFARTSLSIFDINLCSSGAKEVMLG